MEDERKKVFAVSPKYPDLKKQKGLIHRVNKVLKRGS